MCLHHVGEQLGILGERAPIDRLARALESGLRRHRGDRGGIIARDHLDLDALAPEVGEGGGRVGPHPILQQHQGHGLEVGRQGLASELRVRARKEHDPAAGVGVGLHAISDGLGACGL